MVVIHIVLFGLGHVLRFIDSKSSLVSSYNDVAVLDVATADLLQQLVCGCSGRLANDRRAESMCDFKRIEGDPV
jgi:hypothetical protein